MCVVPVALILFIVQDIWGILNFLYRYSTQSSSVLCIRLVVTTCVNIKLILIELNTSNHFENEHKMSTVLSAQSNIFVTHFQWVSDCCLTPSEKFSAISWREQITLQRYDVSDFPTHLYLGDRFPYNWGKLEHKWCELGKDGKSNKFISLDVQ